mgnify:CR=1 FL=1|jgi:hypothetical protein
MEKTAGAPSKGVVHGLLPKPRALAQRSAGDKPKPARIVVFIKKPNPSFSYYLEERLRQLKDLPVFVLQLDELIDVEAQGSFVIICRYATTRQVRWIDKNRSSLAGVAYFIDDDLPAVWSESGSSWGYRLYVGFYALWPLLRLNRQLEQIWVSTETLALTLPAPLDAVTVLPPFPPAIENRNCRPGADVKMIFHSTGSHRWEHEFLRPIVTRALEKHGNLRFEVVASGAEARRWSRANTSGRISVVPPAPWPDYLSSSSSSRCADIALVPLLQGRLNAARSDTKRVDVARLGASAIYSKTAIYDRCACEGEVHLPNDPEEWGNAIDRLVSNEEYRKKAADATAAAFQKMRCLGSAVQLPHLVGLNG